MFERFAAAAGRGRPARAWAWRSSRPSPDAGEAARGSPTGRPAARGLRSASRPLRRLCKPRTGAWTRLYPAASSLVSMRIAVVALLGLVFATGLGFAAHVIARDTVALPVASTRENLAPAATTTERGHHDPDATAPKPESRHDRHDDRSNGDDGDRDRRRRGRSGRGRGRGRGGDDDSSGSGSGSSGSGSSGSGGDDD